MARIDCFSCRLALGVTVTKNEYLENQRGKTYSEIVADQPTTPMVGSIRGPNLRNVVAILASGLQFRLDNSTPNEIVTALQTAFKYLSLPDYAINLALPENQQLLSLAVNAGLVTTQERDQFFALATYNALTFEITRSDCIEYFGPDWTLVSETDTKVIRYQLMQAAPEETYVVVQAQDIRPDNTLSDWYHATSLHGICAARDYLIPVPHNGFPRRFRLRGEYSLNSTVLV